MRKAPRVVFVSELFYPEESATAHILTKIAGEVAHEFDLTVLTGPVSYEGRSQAHASGPPIDHKRIVRTWAPALGKNKIHERLVRLLVLSIGLSWKTLLVSRREDTVFAVSNPAPLLVPLAIIRKIRRFRLVFLVHDVFPENAVAAGVIRPDHFMYPVIRRVFDWAYGSADAVVTIGRDMSEVIARKAPSSAGKITLIENWADHPLIERIARNQSMIPSLGLSDRIVIQYAGNIGRAQGLRQFIDLIAGIENDFVHYVFRGAGAMFEVLRDATKDRSRFLVEGSYLRSQQNQILAACDIALVTLGPGMFGLGVPSKTYNILASGKPVLFLGPKDSEIYRLVKAHEIGWAYDWDEADQLIEFIRRLSMHDLRMIEALGDRARKIAETFYTEANQLPKFSRLFRSLQQSTS
jgi:glycosyltransferase involved in cell wall biosynthesis